jgi:predicted metalloprotease with PDZ domain
MCLDIKLLQLSHGKYGIMNLIQDLSGKYGMKKGFKDEELFSEIGKLTYPGREEFLKTYVGGNQPLPLEQVLQIVGVDYKAEMETKDSVFSTGKVSIGYNSATSRLVVKDTTHMNQLGKTLGYHQDDEFVSVNGEKISLSNANSFFKNFGSSSKAGDSLVINVMRKDATGNYVPVELKATMIKFPVIKYNVLRFSESPSEEQKMLRDKWLKPAA